MVNETLTASALIDLQSSWENRPYTGQVINIQVSHGCKCRGEKKSRDKRGDKERGRVVGGARRGRGGVVTQTLWCDKPSSLL